MARPQKYPWDKIEIDYKAGLSQKEIHYKYDVPYNRLSEWCKKWEQSELAKNVIKGFDDVSERVTELKRTTPELVQPVLDIVKEKHPQLKEIAVNLGIKLLYRVGELIAEASAPDTQALSKSIQTVTDTFGISQRHASQQINVNTQNNVQSNTAIAPTKIVLAVAEES